MPLTRKKVCVCVSSLLWSLVFMCSTKMWPSIRDSSVILKPCLKADQRVTDTSSRFVNAYPNIHPHYPLTGPSCLRLKIFLKFLSLILWIEFLIKTLKRDLQMTRFPYCTGFICCGDSSSNFSPLRFHCLILVLPQLEHRTVSTSWIWS